MNLRDLTLFATLLALSPLAGCGGDSQETPAPLPARTAEPKAGPDAAPAAPAAPTGPVGTWVMDEARTLQGTNASLRGTAPRPKVAKEPAYRLVLEEGGTFTLTVGAGDERFVTSGTWRKGGRILELVTTKVGDDPVPAEMAGEKTDLLEDGDRLVLEGASGRVFLRRATPEEMPPPSPEKDGR